MPLQYSVAVRDAQNDQVETSIGTAPLLRIYNGTIPANCAAALSGNTLLAEGALPSDWLTASASGQKSRNGVWTLTGQAGAGAGTPGTWFSIWNTAGTVRHMQGTFTASGGGGDMTADNNSFANAQAATVNTFNLTRANA
jgi:hypothetical protein